MVFEWDIWKVTRNNVKGRNTWGKKKVKELKLRCVAPGQVRADKMAPCDLPQRHKVKTSIRIVPYDWWFCLGVRGSRRSLPTTI